MPVDGKTAFKLLRERRKFGGNSFREQQLELLHPSIMLYNADRKLVNKKDESKTVRLNIHDTIQNNQAVELARTGIFTRA